MERLRYLWIMLIIYAQVVILRNIKTGKAALMGNGLVGGENLLSRIVVLTVITHTARHFPKDGLRA